MSNESNSSRSGMFQSRKQDILGGASTYQEMYFQFNPTIALSIVGVVASMWLERVAGAYPSIIIDSNLQVSSPTDLGIGDFPPGEVSLISGADVMITTYMNFNVPKENKGTFIPLNIYLSANQPIFFLQASVNRTFQLNDRLYGSIVVYWKSLD
jgi:hypothetical protein